MCIRASFAIPQISLPRYVFASRAHNFWMKSNWRSRDVRSSDFSDEAICTEANSKCTHTQSSIRKVNSRASIGRCRRMNNIVCIIMFMLLYALCWLLLWYIRIEECIYRALWRPTTLFRRRLRRGNLVAPPAAQHIVRCRRWFYNIPRSGAVCGMMTR